MSVHEAVDRRRVDQHQKKVLEEDVALNEAEDSRENRRKKSYDHVRGQNGHLDPAVQLLGGSDGVLNGNGKNSVAVKATVGERDRFLRNRKNSELPRQAVDFENQGPIFGVD